MVLFTTNLLEAVTIAPAPSSAGDVARLTDLDPGPQWAGAVGTVTLDVDLGTSPAAVSSWGLLHHNLTGVTVTVVSGATFPAATARDSVAATGADVFRRFASTTARYWRVTLPALTPPAAPLIGELLLGTPYALSNTAGGKPTLPTGWPAVMGNVARDRSPAGVPYATRRGPPRAKLSYEWAGMSEADWLILAAAFAATNEGERPLLLEDDLGVSRWVTWMDTELTPEALGGHLYHVRSTFEEFVP
jgi:hypothetical protein